MVDYYLFGGESSEMKMQELVIVSPLLKRKLFLWGCKRSKLDTSCAGFFEDVHRHLKLTLSTT